MGNRSVAGRRGVARRMQRITFERERPWRGILFRGGLVGLLSLLAMQQAGAWGRGMPNWASLVDDAEVIAVAHIVGTPVYVTHEPTPYQGTSFEFHARLALDEVLKGKCADPEIPVILHYGLSPSEYIKQGTLVRKQWRGEKPGLAIHDTGATFDMTPILTDARAPAVWLLAHYADRFGRKGGPTEDLSVREPEHLQPIGMLPFFRSILKPDPLAMQLAFLHDPAPENKARYLQYFTARREKGAFPAVADLLSDPDRIVFWFAIEACVALGGKAAIPQLRSLLDTADADVFWSAADALAHLHDVASVPRLTRVLAADARPHWRGGAATALGWMGDPAAIPALIGALSDDGCYDPNNYLGGEVWCPAQEALRRLTRCRLSPNGSKAARWWAAAKGMAPTAWEHFGIADLIASMHLLGPDALNQEQVSLCGRCSVPQVGPPDTIPFRNPAYSPHRIQDWWRHWLARQGWQDYQSLPSQVDDELAVTAELTAPLNSGKPVHLRYVLANKSAGDVWLTRQHYEVWDGRGASGNGSSGGRGSYARPRASSAADFVRISAGQQLTVVGDATIWNDPYVRFSEPPHLISAALCFERKGTSCGLNAWVGEVWAEPFVVPATGRGG